MCDRKQAFHGCCCRRWDAGRRHHSAGDAVLLARQTQWGRGASSALCLDIRDVLSADAASCVLVDVRGDTVDLSVSGNAIDCW